MSRGKTSFPAGTGVWVVKTDEEITTSFASSKDIFFSVMSFLMSSRPIKAE
jgi:hypothetical protein